MFTINGFCSFRHDMSSLYWKRICGIMTQRSAKNTGGAVYSQGNEFHISSTHKYGFAQSGDIMCVFAGRIVNFRLLKEQLKQMGAGECKTFAQILLNLYKFKGARGAALIFGEFSAAIYDSEKEKMIIFSDKAGCFPLYYICKNQRFVFSSSINALFTFPGVYPVVTKEALRDMFCMPCRIHPEKTAFEGIMRVPGGCCVEFKKSGVSVKRYFTLNPADKFNCEYLARDAIRLRGGATLERDVPCSDFRLVMCALDNTEYTALPSYLPVYYLLCTLKHQQDGKISIPFLPPSVPDVNLGFLLRKECFTLTELKIHEKDRVYEHTNVYFDDEIKQNHITEKRLDIQTRYTSWWESVVRFSQMSGKDIQLPMTDARFLECVTDGGGDEYIYKGKNLLPSAEFARKILKNELGTAARPIYSFMDEKATKSFIDETDDVMALLYILATDYWSLRFRVTFDTDEI